MQYCFICKNTFPQNVHKIHQDAAKINVLLIIQVQRIPGCVLFSIKTIKRDLIYNFAYMHTFTFTSMQCRVVLFRLLLSDICMVLQLNEGFKRVCEIRFFTKDGSVTTNAQLEVTTFADKQRKKNRGMLEVNVARLVNHTIVTENYR